MTDSGYCVVLCCRANSERLPQKALAELAPGLTVLDQLIQRWQHSDRKPTLILATPAEPCNDPLAAVAAAHGIPVSRNPPGNAVAEIDAAVRRFAPGAKYVARALADNPLVDISLADWRLDILAETGADGLHYGDHERITYAGTTDVWSRAAWDRIAAESAGVELEHPGAHFWNRLSSYAAVQIPLPRREYLFNLRTELDTLLDLELFQAVWAGWQAEWQDPDDAPACVSTLWALKWLDAHPLVARINREVRVKTQSKAVYGARDKAWLCSSCSRRVGSVKEGNLEIHCHHCGQAKRFFSAKPKASDRGWVP